MSFYQSYWVFLDTMAERGGIPVCHARKIPSKMVKVKPFEINANF
jgi:hypothetical protein